MVVFEFVRFLVSAIVACRLTLTLVVFECVDGSAKTVTALDCLTLTLVVFESSYPVRRFFRISGLTLTLVVFEYKYNTSKGGETKSLTLTLVVFE